MLSSGTPGTSHPRSQAASRAAAWVQMGGTGLERPWTAVLLACAGVHGGGHGAYMLEHARPIGLRRRMAVADRVSDPLRGFRTECDCPGSHSLLQRKSREVAEKGDGVPHGQRAAAAIERMYRRSRPASTRWLPAYARSGFRLRRGGRAVVEKADDARIDVLDHDIPGT